MQRIQKLIASAGYLSRRQAEQAIANGRVKIEQKPAVLGDKIDLNATVYLDGKRIDLNRFNRQNSKVLAINKAVGVICSRQDDKKRSTIFNYLPANERWVMVGRLDVNSSGLLLFTTNGELAHRLMHPSYKIPRKYAVRVLGNVQQKHIAKLTTGIQLDGRRAKFNHIVRCGGSGANHWYQVTIQQGLNREVRRLWQSQGFAVSRLIRIGYGAIDLARELPTNQPQKLKKKPSERFATISGLEP